MKGKIHKTLYALEINIFNPEDNFQIAKDFFRTNKKGLLIEKAQSSACDILCLKFNIKNKTDIPKSSRILKALLPKITKPLMINGVYDNNLNRELLPALISVLDRKCIISSANEQTYREILPHVIKGKHKLVLKSPIDINLCRELNILVTDSGLPLNQLIIDTDIGGLGYGLDYGYSIIEKIKLEDDEYLNLPIISFVAQESLRTKEAQYDTFSKSWGDLKTRAKMFEIASAAAVKAAGADIIVLYNPDSIKVMKGLA